MRPAPRVFKRVPPPARVQPLQLTQPFTITYRAACRSYNYGSIVHHSLRLTLSYDGTDLLYRSEDMSTHVIRTILYDGHETYEADNNSRIAVIEEGFDFDRMLYCPLPGVGIPKMPLLTAGFLALFLPRVHARLAAKMATERRCVDPALYKTPGLVRDYGASVYADHEPRAGNLRSSMNSVVSVPSGGVPKVLWYDTFENIGPNLGHHWEFYGHERFQGIWLAKRVRMRWYASIPVSRRTGKPTHYADRSTPTKNVLLQSATYDIAQCLNQPLRISLKNSLGLLLNYASLQGNV